MSAVRLRRKSNLGDTFVSTPTGNVCDQLAGLRGFRLLANAFVILCIRCESG